MSLTPLSSKTTITYESRCSFTHFLDEKVEALHVKMTNWNACGNLD